MDTSITNKEIWVLEDEESCRFVYEQTLNHRYKTRYFETIAEFSNALEQVTANDMPAMLVADLMLGDGNFLNFLTDSSRSEIMNIPFIIVSGIDDIDALRFCFKEGALDYLTKPFKKNELLVKIENVLSDSTKTNKLESGQKSIHLDGKEVQNLTSKQMQLLNLFMNSSDRCISRMDILENVWGKTNVHPKTVDVHLYNLRRKLHAYGYLIRSDGGGRWSLLSDRIEEKIM
jgi:DNA-binding response OmpR family regulator